DHFSRLDATSLIQSEYFRAAHGTLKPLRSCTELKAYKGTAFEQPLRTAFQKLQAATGSANISVSWEDLDSAISSRQFAAYLPDATIFSEIAKEIQNKEG